MPLLGALLSGALTAIFTLISSLVGAQIAARILAVAFVAALYVALVLAFSALIAPWIGSIFTSEYGQLLGLLFPPVAGTVMASLSAFWGVVIGYRYVSTLTKMAVG
jgi:hypothetical protein